MKWSSSSNSSLSNGNVVTMALNNSNNNNSSISSSGSNTSASYGQNGGVTRAAATVRRHASDRRSIFYTDPSDMEIFLKNHNNKKVRCIIRISFSPQSFFAKTRDLLCSNNIGDCFLFVL